MRHAGSTARHRPHCKRRDWLHQEAATCIPDPKPKAIKHYRDQNRRYMREDGTPLVHSNWDHTIEIIFLSVVPFPCQGPLTAGDVADWGPIIRMLQRCGINTSCGSYVSIGGTPRSVSATVFVANLSSKVSYPPPHLWTDCCSCQAHAMSYY